MQCLLHTHYHSAPTHAITLVSRIWSQEIIQRDYPFYPDYPTDLNTGSHNIDYADIHCHAFTPVYYQSHNLIHHE